MEGQNHPLYSVDRDHLDRLLTVKTPRDEDLIDIARLFMRYEDFPGAKDLQSDLLRVLHLWNISKEDLHRLTRAIWGKGFRPNSFPNEIVGSSFDTSENSVN